jgi:hypothetical protein
MKRILTRRIKVFARFCALKLGQKSEKLSIRKKKIWVVLFCLVYGGISASIILHNLNRGRAAPGIIQVGHIPAHIGRTNGIRLKPFFTETALNRVELLKKYLDSLSRSDKDKYDTIIIQRPRLLDSIKLFEKLYFSQSKNKNGN